MRSTSVRMKRQSWEQPLADSPPRVRGGRSIVLTTKHRSLNRPVAYVSEL